MVRFICLEILTIGVLAFECAFRARWFSLVQRACFLIFFDIQKLRLWIVTCVVTYRAAALIERRYEAALRYKRQLRLSC